MERYIAGYVRVSTEMQVERDSLVNQQEAIKAYAASKGVTHRLFIDAGISAKDTERPALQELLDEMRANRVETVVVVKLDRLTRSLRDLVDLYELFEEHEVSLVSLTQSLDTSNPMGRFVFYVLGLVAQMERELTAEREMENMQARARRGKWNGGPSPFGYTCKNLEVRRWLEGEARATGSTVEELSRDPQVMNRADAHALSVVGEPKTLVVDEQEAKVVRAMYDAFLQLRSLRGVTHHVNRMGMKTRHGLPWAATSVKRILGNPFYKGTLAYNRRRGYKRTSKHRPEDEHILVEGVIPAIVDEDTWDRVAAILQEQKGLSSAQKRSPLLLSGLVHCGRCGGKMFGSGNKKRGQKAYHYYRCNNHLSKGSSVCPGTSVRVEVLDRVITDAIRTIGMKPHAVREQLQEQQARYQGETVPLLEKEKELQAALKQNRNRTMRLIELYEEEAIAKDEFQERRLELERDKQQLEEELARVRARLGSGEMVTFDIEQAVGMLGNLGAVFEALEFQDKRELIRTVLRDIRVDESTVSYKVRVLPDLFVFSDRRGRGSWLLPG
jgi:site-specific DNA recombinase